MFIDKFKNELILKTPLGMNLKNENINFSNTLLAAALASQIKIK